MRASQWRLFAIVAFVIVLTAFVQAQSISGAVTDPSGAVVPNAIVTAMSTALYSISFRLRAPGLPSVL